jgi:hypothetical protein
MDRCRQCNSTLAPAEKVCWGCNAEVPEKNPKSGVASRFQTVVNVLFIVFAVVTVLSLFLPSEYVPPFKRCLAALVILFLVRSSMHAMTAEKKT